METGMSVRGFGGLLHTIMLGTILL
jgi:hypothetical protein